MGQNFLNNISIQIVYNSLKISYSEEWLTLKNL